MLKEYAVVDLFAGPGGLAEGFSSVGTSGNRPFRIVLSVEKDPAAHQTLLLRSFLRQFQELPEEYYRFLNQGEDEPDWRYLYPKQWSSAEEEALLLELGTESASAKLNPVLDDIRELYQGNAILIGGPPCQAYSLAGRARNKGNRAYIAEEDHRHYLYQEYIEILKKLRPAAFVLENVKGMLSSSIDGGRIFDRVLSDLEALGNGSTGYELAAVAPGSQEVLALSDAERHLPISRYIVKAEDFGLPQSRHRVIIVGIRMDLAARLDKDRLTRGLLEDTSSRATVRDVLQGMPKLRSGLSRTVDTEAAWRDEILAATTRIANLAPELPGNQVDNWYQKAVAIRERLASAEYAMARTGEGPVGIGPNCPPGLKEWILRPGLEVLLNNETRSHMPSDFARYLFTSLFGEVTGFSPKARHFPSSLAPDHKSWATGGFADRFRVQIWDEPSTTVTSHIAKDGHAFIHPDPMQCRSLTVREAARLQTFPDDYYFKGNRTQQYIQVGNAVPPYLARKIAQALFDLLENESGLDSASDVHTQRNP